MPVYDYECEECSAQFELRRGFSDKSEARCPRCEGKARRLFRPVPVIFNGPGFYVTDNRRNGPKSEDAETASCK
jgi:putative FmdB family regulatory protein